MKPLEDSTSLRKDTRASEAQRPLPSPTPGPWHMRDTSDENGKWGAVYADRECICSGMNQPNARLIAAAPDLLEALERIAQSAECLPTWHDSPTLQQARAAIARARGQSPTQSRLG